jgi:hypothetical protein
MVWNKKCWDRNGYRRRKSSAKKGIFFSTPAGNIDRCYACSIHFNTLKLDVLHFYEDIGLKIKHGEKVTSHCVLHAIRISRQMEDECRKFNIFQEKVQSSSDLFQTYFPLYLFAHKGMVIGRCKEFPPYTIERAARNALHST